MACRECHKRSHSFKDWKFNTHSYKYKTDALVIISFFNETVKLNYLLSQENKIFNENEIESEKKTISILHSIKELLYSI